jgi:hypothetical protein
VSKKQYKNVEIYYVPQNKNGEIELVGSGNTREACLEVLRTKISRENTWGAGELLEFRAKLDGEAIFVSAIDYVAVQRALDKIFGDSPNKYASLGWPEWFIK